MLHVDVAKYFGKWNLFLGNRHFFNTYMLSTTHFQVEDKGALSNLRSMLFSGQGLHSLREWLAKHWYVAAAGGIGLISFVVSNIHTLCPQVI